MDARVTVKQNSDFRRFYRRGRSAVSGGVVVYCLKNVQITAGSHGLPELIAISVVAALHLWKKQTLLSIAGGTLVYMLLVQFVFI